MSLSKARQIESRNDARKARLSDAVLLDVFMRRRKICLDSGYSLVAASDEAHEAVDEVQRRSANPIAPDPLELERTARNAGKWANEI